MKNQTYYLEYFFTDLNLQSYSLYSVSTHSVNVRLFHVGTIVPNLHIENA